MDLRRAGDRAVTRADGIELRHALSAGHHYDPANTSYGPLVAHDEIVLGPGAGFPAHRHRDLEVVTWVLEGELEHHDDLGPPARLGPGTVQVLSTGSGVEHTETAGAEGALFLQARLVPDAVAAAPSCRRAVTALGAGQTVVAGAGTALPLGCDAVLLAARPPAGAALALPVGRHLHLHVARGEVEVDGVVLRPGDALRRDGGGGRLAVSEGAELLLWVAGLTPPSARREWSPPTRRRPSPSGAG